MSVMSNQRVGKNTEKCQIFASSIYLSPTWNPQALLNPGALLPQSVHFWPTASLFVFAWRQETDRPENRCSEQKHWSKYLYALYKTKLQPLRLQTPNNSAWMRMYEVENKWEICTCGKWKSVSRSHKNFWVFIRKLSVMQSMRTGRKNFLLKFWFLPFKPGRRIWLWICNGILPPSPQKILLTENLGLWIRVRINPSSPTPRKSELVMENFKRMWRLCCVT